METDAELVIRSRRGDPRAFDTLVRRHYKTALRAARRFAAIPEDADDLTQEAFVAACERLHQLAHPERFAGWLVTIVRNEGRMWHRRRFTQPTLFSLDDEEADSSSGNTEAARRNAVRDAIADAVSSLTAEQRDVVRLHYLDGYDYRETALLLDIPVGAVRGRLDRARNTLRKELHEMATTSNEWKLDARDLDALRHAATCALDTAEPERQALNALFFNGNGELIGADGHRIFRYASPSLQGIGPVLIHADLGRTLRDSHAEAGKGKLSVSGGEAVLRVNGDEIRAPLIEEAYPNWERAIPAGWELRSVARSGDWLAAIERLARCGEMPENRVVMILAPEDGLITLRAGDKPPGGVAWDVSGSFQAKFPVIGRKLAIAANIIYVEQAVRARAGRARRVLRQRAVEVVPGQAFVRRRPLGAHNAHAARVAPAACRHGPASSCPGHRARYFASFSWEASPDGDRPGRDRALESPPTRQRRRDAGAANSCFPGFLRGMPRQVASGAGSILGFFSPTSVMRRRRSARSFARTEACFGSRTRLFNSKGSAFRSYRCDS